MLAFSNASITYYSIDNLLFNWYGSYCANKWYSIKYFYRCTKRSFYYYTIFQINTKFNGHWITFICNSDAIGISWYGFVERTCELPTVCFVLLGAGQHLYSVGSRFPLKHCCKLTNTTFHDHTSSLSRSHCIMSFTVKIILYYVQVHCQDHTVLCPSSLSRSHCIMSLKKCRAWKNDAWV